MDKLTGGVVYRVKGKRIEVLLREPKNHLNGYVWTFAHLPNTPNKRPSQTAQEAVYDLFGVKGIVGYGLGNYKLNDDVFMYLIAYHETVDYTDETQSVLWCRFEEAYKRIHKTTYRAGRDRDLKILSDTAFALLSGWR